MLHGSKFLNRYRSVGDTGTHLEVFINDEAEFTEWAVRFGFMVLDATAVPFDS